MIRKIVIPQERTLVLELPEEFVGKEVEVLAFAVEEEASTHENSPATHKKPERLQKIRDTFSKYRVDMSDFKFDRDEANNYTISNFSTPSS